MKLLNFIFSCATPTCSENSTERTSSWHTPRAMSSGGGGFGVPLPLPGQKDKRPIVRESDRLHLDAVKMEERLAKLKIQLTKEKERRENTSLIGSAMWRSARADQTQAIRGYAKEVQRQMMAKKGSVGSVSASSGVRKDVRRPSPGQNIASEGSNNNHSDYHNSIWQRDPMTWTVRDTTTWLASLNLPQYQEQFARNEISGPILLEIGLDDLNYMNITVLAHRKILLKAVEELRHGPRPPPPPSHQQEQQQQHKNGSSSSSHLYSVDLLGGSSTQNKPVVKGNKPREVVLISRPRKINGGDEDEEMEEQGYEHRAAHHHHHAMPGGGRGGPSSHGDGGGGTSSLLDGEYDEREARLSFQEAVMAWRQASGSRSSNGGKGDGSSQGAVAIERDATPEDEGRGVEEEEDGMWRNPFMTGTTPRRRPDSRSSRGGGHDVDGRERQVDGGVNPGAGMLWGRLPDEAKEHQAFAAAVEEWRRGSRSSNNNNHNDSEQQVHVDGGNSPVPRPQARRSMDDMAKDLAMKLEEQHRQCREELARKKEEYMQKLKEAAATKEESALSTCTTSSRAAETADVKGSVAMEESIVHGGADGGREEKKSGEGGPELDGLCSTRADGKEDEREEGVYEKEWWGMKHGDGEEDDDDDQGRRSMPDGGDDDETEGPAMTGAADMMTTSVRIEEVGTIMGYTPRGGTRRRNPLTGMVEEEEGKGEEEYSVVEQESDDEEGAGREVTTGAERGGMSSIREAGGDGTPQWSF